MPQTDHFTSADRETITVLKTDIGYIKNAIEKIERSVDKRDVHLQAQLDSQEKRLRLLENFRWYLLGFSGALSVVGPIVLKLLHIL